MPTPYPELEIGLHRVQPGGFQVELRFADASSAAERAPVRAPCPLDPEALLALELDPEAYGRALSGQVFADPGVIRFLGEVKASVARADLPLRLRLLTDPSAPDLEALRWELLCDPDTGAPYATSERILFSRFMQSPDWRAVRLRPKAELSALVAVAAPRDIGAYGLAEVDLPGEVERARGALGEISTRVLGQEQPLTIDALTDALRSGVDILYLVAHGALDRARGPVLFLQDAAGKVRRERGDDLARRVGELRDLPRLVVLASCESAAAREGGQATGPAADATPRAAPAQAALAPQLAAAGVPAILAMQGRISMETVATLMPRFFQELVADGQIDRALAVARGLVRDRPDAWMPALFLRLRGGRLWDPPAVSSGDDDSALSLYGRVVVLGERDTDPARPVPAIPVQILGVGETLTNDLGEFRLEHERFRPGAPVTAEVRHPGHVIYRPYRGRFNLPRPAADRPDEPVELALLPEGSARLLDDYTFKLLAEDMKEEAVEQLRPEGSPEEIDFTRYLESLGRALGFSLADVERGLADWQGRKQADPGTDPYELGLVAVTEKDFARARGLFRRSRLGHESARAALEARMAEMQAQMQAQIAEQERLIVRDLDAEATAAALAYDFRAALDLRQEILGYQDRAADPEAWASAQVAKGNAHQELGHPGRRGRGPTPPGGRRLGLSRGPGGRTRAELPQDWAMTQNNLGIALQEQGTRTDGEAGRALLEQAVSAYRAALEVRTRAELPQDWAMTQNNLGTALQEQGLRTDGEAGRALLDAGGLGLSRGPGGLHPRRAAAGLGHDPEQPRHRTPGAGHPHRRRGGPGAARPGGLGLSRGPGGLHPRRAAAGLGHDPEQPRHRTPGAGHPHRRRGGPGAARAGGLGLSRGPGGPHPRRAAAGLGRDPEQPRHRTPGAGHPHRRRGGPGAARAGGLGLSRGPGGRTRAELPQDWAATQNNLGTALQEQGLRTDGEAGRALLEQAVSAYRAALEVRTRAELPQDWAMTQNNLGIALQEQGTRTDGEAGRALLEQAVSAYRAALEVYTRAELPQDWATTQNNLGSRTPGAGHPHRRRGGPGAARAGGLGLSRGAGGLHPGAHRLLLGDGPEEPAGHPGATSATPPAWRR